ncbi:hypothetical protein GOV07_03085 [Candidatus Woesearchaeota archaeon]|nr:hypothetical protein [Candidatus Woesearchaeota archaeon]
MRTKAQVWSMDLIIAVVIFLLAIGVFYFFTEGKVEEDTSRLQIESQIIANRLTGDENISIVKDGAIDDEKLQTLILKNDEYDKLKEELGVHDDFCMVLRDQNGSIILIGNGTDNRVGIGSPHIKVNISGVTYNCSESYPKP